MRPACKVLKFKLHRGEKRHAKKVRTMPRQERDNTWAAFGRRRQQEVKS